LILNTTKSISDRLLEILFKAQVCPVTRFGILNLPVSNYSRKVASVNQEVFPPEKVVLK
jgi:hypothetical protein